MHTYTASDGTTFIYNPDLSDLRIVVPNGHVEDASYLTDATSAEPISHVHVSGPAVREFIVHTIRNDIVSELENFDISKLFN